MDASSQARPTPTPTPTGPSTATPNQTQVGSSGAALEDVNTGTSVPLDDVENKSKITSVVWKHFVRLSKEEAKCKYCHKTLKAKTQKNGTSGLRKHHRRCPKNPEKPKPGQTTLAFPAPRVGEEGKLISVSFSQERCRRAVVEFIIKDEMSFRAVEGEGFRALMNVLEPKFRVPGRMTVYRGLLEIYLEEKVILKNYFKASKQRVSLTTDTWTSPNNFNYICVTVHFVDQNWKLQKRILMFCEVKGHTGVAIGEMLEKCLVDWGLEDVFGVTLDNVSANTLAMKYLKQSVIGWTKAEVRAKYLHVRCAAHVLALVVKDAVRVYNKSISRIRSVVKYVKASPARLVKFKHCASLEKVECKKNLILDVKTRWNSTYLMLDAAEKFERAFARLANYDKEYKKKYCFPHDKSVSLPNVHDFDIDFNDQEEDAISAESESENENDTEEEEEVYSNPIGKKKKIEEKKKKPHQHAPYPEDWNYARALVKCLQVFFDATVKFSASTYPTTHTFLWELVLIHEQLVEFRNNVNSDPFIATMADKMFMKYNSYWGKYSKMNSAMIFAQLLDPREKEKGLEFTLACLYENDSMEVASVMRNVLEEFKILFEEYKDAHSIPEEGGSSIVHGHGNQATLVQDQSVAASLMSRKKRHKTNPSVVECKTELDRYFMDVMDDEIDGEGDFDILAWWKTNSNKYKILAHIAKDILAIPVSSVASESAFSTGKRVLSQTRSSLSTRTVEALICTQSWLRKPVALDLLCDFVPDDNAEIEEELLGPITNGSASAL